MKLFLEINGQWVEPEFSKDSNELALDWFYGSLESPADYIGEHAFDFLVPRSQHNNEIFNKFYRLDGLVNPNTFDPAIKLPYQILSDGSQVISTGTAYIHSIDQNNYKIALSGALHTIFSKALNSGWSTVKAEEDTDYYLLPEYIKIDKGGRYTGEPVINAELVLKSWEKEHLNQSWEHFVQSLQTMSGDITNTVASEIITWIPTHQGVPEGMSQDKWVYEASDGSEVLYPIFSKTGTELIRPLEIGDDLREYQMAEFRSYNQQPAIYVKRLWEWYAENFNSMTGYDLRLDYNWFNDENPYLKDLYYTLPKLKRNYVLDHGVITMDETNESDGATFPSSFSLNGMNNLHVTNTFEFPDGFTGGDLKINWFPWLIYPHQGDRYFLWNWQDYCYVVTIRVMSADGSLKYQEKHAFYVIPWSNETSHLGPSADVVRWAQANTDQQHYFRYLLDTNQYPYYYFQYVFAEEVGKGYDIIFTSMVEEGDYLEVETRVHGVEDNYPLCRGFYLRDSTMWDHLIGDYFSEGDPHSFFYVIAELQAKVNVFGNSQAFEIRSNSPISLERLFESENPFSILLKYSKYNNLIWLVDDYNKRVTVYERNQHFYECVSKNSKLPKTGNIGLDITGVLDITKYVDTSDEVRVLPIDWNAKYLYMNFAESGCEYLDEYLAKYKRTYGSKMLTTQNKRTEQTKNVFCNNDNDTVVEAADVAPYYLPIGTAYDHAIQAYQADTLLLNSKESNTSGADAHGQFVFRNPNGRWQSRLYENFRANCNGVLISDDTTLEINNQNYYYHGSGNIGTDIVTLVKPNFSPINTLDNVAFWFALPRDAYAPMNYAENTTTLFSKWSSYLSEIYDINNKTLECRIHISDTMYRRLKINPLVQIDNCVFIVVSMEGYNENSPWVKVTLKQFSTIEGLCGGAVANPKDDDPIWLWDDETEVAFDDETFILVGDGNRIFPPQKGYESIIDTDEKPQLPETVDDIVRKEQTKFLPI